MSYLSFQSRHLIRPKFLAKYFNVVVSNKKISSTSDKEEVRLRFAPSPTGRLHIGGLRTALYNYLFSHKYNGKLILRIEDTDRERYKEGSIEFLLQSLDWTGVKFDYGPHVKKDDDPSQGAPWQQSERLHLYQKFSRKLLEDGKAYRCFCDETRLELLRREASKRQEKISYDGKCRHLDPKTVEKYLQEGRRNVIRFKMNDKNIIFNDLINGMHSSNPGKNEGDFIIIKSDSFPTYHFAHVVDDYLMRISHVLRGQEWLLSTPKHIAIYEAFGWKQPQYGHLPLICNSDGTKISKRQNDIDVLSYRDRGYFPETVLVYLSSIGGGLKSNVKDFESFFTDNNSILAKLTKEFDESRINNRSVKLNQELLDRLNRHFLKIKLKNENEASQIVSQMRTLLLENFPDLPKKYLEDEYLRTVLNWSTERIYKINDLITDSGFSYLWKDMSSFSDNQMDATTRTKMLELIEYLNEYLLDEAIEDSIFNDKTIFKKEMTRIFKQLKVRSKSDTKVNYWQLIRLVLTGSVQGPPVFEIFNLLKKSNVIYRLNAAENHLKI